MKYLFLLFFASILFLPELSADWQKGRFRWDKCTPVARGILQADWTFSKPRLIRVFALRIDLQTRGMKFHVTGKAPDYGQPMPGEPGFVIRTRRQTTLDFFKELQQEKKLNVAAAVNTAPWGPWKAPWIHPYADRMGALISAGEVVVPPDGRRPSFIADKNGKFRLGVLAKNADTSRIQCAVSGFRYVLEKGKIQGDNRALAPRTGFGMSSDGRYLYIVVADGRQQDYSMGMTQYEVGTFLRYLGADSGINMDGGGSSTMVVLRNGKPVMLNRHRKNAIRKVGASLAISIAQ